MAQPQAQVTSSGCRDTAVALFHVLTLYLFTHPTPYAEKRFDGLKSRFLFVACQNAGYIERLHLRINYWSDEEILKWKECLITNCKSISVAAAVFAGIGLAAVQMTHIEQVYWTARALLLASMAAGVLAVICATHLQRDIIMCNSALDIRFWLSNGRTQKKLKNDCRGLDQFSHLPLESSVSAAMMIHLPAQLLDFSVILFFVGFGIYLLSCWLDHVDKTGDPHASRNIFVVFAAVVGLLVLQMAMGYAMRELDHAKRKTHYDDLGNHMCHSSFAEEKSLRDLKDKLRRLGHEVLDSGDEDTPLQGNATMEPSV